MRIIEIREDKVSKLGEHIEQALRHAGKAMQCIEEMQHGMGERVDYGRYGMRDGYAMRDGYGMREDMTHPYGERYERMEDDDMGERRRSRMTGRYMR